MRKRRKVVGVLFASILTITGSGCTQKGTGQSDYEANNGYPLVAEDIARDAAYELKVPGFEVQPVLISSIWPDGDKFPSNVEVGENIEWPEFPSMAIGNSAITLFLSGPAAPFEVLISEHFELNEFGVPPESSIVERCSMPPDELSRCTVVASPFQEHESQVRLKIPDSRTRYLAVQATWVIETQGEPSDIMHVWTFSISS